MSPAPPGFIVEFAGLPASGKSTLSHVVARCLREQDELVTERTREVTRWRLGRRSAAKLHLAGRFLLASPRESFALLRDLARSGARGTAERVSVFVNLLYVQGLIAECQRRPGVHLLDQGFFQALWSFSFRGQDRVETIDRLARIASKRLGRPPADLVVFVEAPRATIVERLAARAAEPQSRLDASVGSPDFPAQLEAAERALEAVRSVVERLSASSPGRIRFATLSARGSDPAGPHALALISAIRAARGQPVATARQ